MDKEEFIQSGLLEQYALGLTSPEDSERVERFLSMYPELEARLSEMRFHVESYADQYLEQPTRRMQLERGATRFPFMTLLVSAVMTLLVLSVALLLRQNNRHDRQFVDLHEEYLIEYRGNQRNVTLLNNARKEIELLKHDHTQAFFMEDSSGTSADLYQNSVLRRGLLHFNHYTPPADGLQYVLLAEVDTSTYQIRIFDQTLRREWIDLPYVAANHWNLQLEPPLPDSNVASHRSYVKVMEKK